MIWFFCDVPILQQYHTLFGWWVVYHPNRNLCLYHLYNNAVCHHRVLTNQWCHQQLDYLYWIEHSLFFHDDRQHFERISNNFYYHTIDIKTVAALGSHQDTQQSSQYPICQWIHNNNKIDYQQSYWLDTYILVAQMHIATYTVLSNRVAIYVVYHNKLNCLHHKKYFNKSNYVIVQLLCTDTFCS